MLAKVQIVGGGGGVASSSSANLANSSSKIVATLRADGNVYPTKAASLNNQLSNLQHYEIRTEGELLKKSTLNSVTTVLDLGKQLLQCARDSDVEGVRNALAHGAPFASDWLGMTALHFAAMNNQLEICEILVQGGINIDSKTKVDRTPLHLAAYYGHDRVVALLLALKCAINTRDMLRMTPLHWAVEKRHKATVRLLLRYNADVTLLSKFGKTPIALAVITEQPDILIELEAVRQTQINRKLNEESEKETSAAVNAIIKEVHSQKEAQEEDAASARMGVLENLSGKKSALPNAALNMLKTHGIADMMEEGEADESKDLLNTALRNGRQLVLSEGGRMLLHETKTPQSTNGLNNNLNNNNNNKNVKSSQAGKIRMNVIKQKESTTNSSLSSVSKNKNIRIISLSDFKKLCGTVESQSKSLQKIPSTLASSGVVRQLSDGTKLVKMRQVQSRQLKLPCVPNSTKLATTTSKADEKSPPPNEEVAHPIAPNPAPTTTCTRGQVGTVQTIQLKPVPTPPVSHNNGTVNKSSLRLRKFSNEVSTTKPPNIMPLLSTSEICRQLYEQRRLNEELRRRLDTVERQNNNLIERLERVEHVLMLHESDVEFVDV